MLKTLHQYLNKAITSPSISYTHKHYQNRPAFLWNTLAYSFNKKMDFRKKRSQAPKVAPKAITDYMTGPDQLKKNILQVRNLQSTSQATLEENSLKQIIVEQRTLLNESLREQLAVPTEPADKQSLNSKILGKYMAQQQLNKYYIKRPLKYLQNIYFGLFLVNAISFSWLQFTNAYNSMGWFFGYFTTPAATAAVALLIGYNFSFWVVRQAFHLHVPLANIPKTKISLIQTTWRNVAELTFIASQFMALMYCLSFGCPFSIYKLHLLLVSTNFGFLAINLYEILRHSKISFRAYLAQYLRIISLSTLLVLIFALYQIQVSAGSKPDDVFEDDSYRSRVIAVSQGYKEYINFFKKKKYLMKEDEKINPLDGE